MPGGRTARLRGHPGSGARHRRRDAPDPRATHRPPRDPRLTPVETFDVGIVGAGVHGASAAFHLASRGLNVVIFERWTPAGGPTGRSSAVCRAYYTNTFLAAAARDSIAMMERFKELTGVDAGYRRTGMLFLHPLDDVNDVEVVGGAVEPVGDRHLVVRPGTLHPRVPVVQPGRDRGCRARARRRLCRPIRDYRRALPASDRAGSGREDGCSGGEARDLGTRGGRDQRRRNQDVMWSCADRRGALDEAAGGPGWRRPSADGRATRGGDVPVGGRRTDTCARGPDRAATTSVPRVKTSIWSDRCIPRRRPIPTTSISRSARTRSAGWPRRSCIACRSSKGRRSTAAGPACTTSAPIGSRSSARWRRTCSWMRERADTGSSSRRRSGKHVADLVSRSPELDARLHDFDPFRFAHGSSLAAGYRDARILG